MKSNKRALKKLESQRRKGKDVTISDRTLNVLEAVMVCDEILDESEGVTYDDDDEEGVA